MRRLRFLTVCAILVASTLAACGAPRGGGYASSSASSSASSAGEGEVVDWNVTPKPRHLTGRPLRVRYLAYRSRQSLQLVNESHSDPHRLYSQKVSVEEASTKVQSDEVMDALVERLREHGFFDRAQVGPAPPMSSSSYSQAFEVEGPDGVKHWKVLDKSSEKDRRDFLLCAKDFVDLYNETIQMQAVDHAPDWKGDGKQYAPPRRPGSGKVQ